MDDKLLSETGINFTSSDGVKLSDLNSMKNTIDDLVRIVNKMLKGKYDVNLEYNDFERVYSLSEALRAVSSNRRALGMKIRFKGTSKYIEYSFIGDSIDDEVFLNEDNWVNCIEIIDGGLF